MGKKDRKINEMFTPKELGQTKHYSKKTSLLVIILTLVLAAILTVVGTVIIQNEFSDSGSFGELVENNYILSVITLIAVCALQVMIALIPGELVEIASGYAFGTFWGAVYCMVGILLGSCIVIWLTRKIGRRFIESLCPREKIDSISFLKDKKKLHMIVALVFFIPGTPKDLITYAIALTGMKIPAYILITSIARLPSILISTLSGSALGESNIKSALVFFVISAVTGIAGYFAYHFIMQKRKKSDSDSDSVSDTNEK